MSLNRPALRVAALVEKFPIDRVTQFGMVALGFIVLTVIAYRLEQATQLIPMHYNEGWNAYHALRYQQTGSPYPPNGGLVMNNYPPLWFVIVAAVGRATGSLIFAGRAVASVGLAVLLTAAAAIGATLRGKWGAVSAFVSVAFLVCFEGYTYIGIADPQLLAQGVSLCGLLLCLRARDIGDRTFLAGVAVAFFAPFIKHNLVALPLALVAAAAFNSKRILFRVVLAAMASGTASYFICSIFGGFDWPLRLGSARTYYHGLLLNLTLPFLTANVMGLMLAAIGVVTLSKGFQQRILLIYGAFTLPIAIQFTGGAGVAVNIFFDTMVVMALGASLITSAGTRLRSVSGAESHSITTFPRWTMALGLNAWLLVTALPTLKDIVYNFRRQELLAKQRADFAEDVNYLKSVPGAAICDQPAVCYMAGKPFIYDPFNAGEAIATGAVSADRVRAILHADSVQIIHVRGELATTPDVPPPIAAEVNLEFSETLRNERGAFRVRNSTLRRTQ